MKALQGMRSLRAVSLAPSTSLSSLSASSARHPRLFSSTSRAASSAWSFHHHTTTKRPRQGRPSSPILSCCNCCSNTTPPTPRRSFHLATLANTAVDVTEATIAQLHYVTLTPWYVTIPLVALSVNLVFRLPLSVHARNLTLKRARLNPLLRSWANIHTEQVLKERQRRRQNVGGGEVPVDMSVSAVQADVMKRHAKTSARIYAQFGVQQWKLYANILALPPWLVVIEAIRRMCGAPVGLLGMVFRRGAGVDSVAAAADSATAAASLSEPSLATGGCLWFPDLTAADPYHVLPFALSAVLVINILPSTDAGRRMLFGLPAAADGAVVAQSAVARGIHRSLLIMSCSVGFVTLNFPAAIHLYWLSSAGTTYGIAKALQYLKPVANVDPPLRQHREGPWIVPKAPAEARE